MQCSLACECMLNKWQVFISNQSLNAPRCQLSSSALFAEHGNPIDEKLAAKVQILKIKIHTMTLARKSFFDGNSFILLSGPFFTYFTLWRGLSVAYLPIDPRVVPSLFVSLCFLVFASSANELYFSFQILINFQICFFVSYICSGWWKGGNGNNMFAYWEKRFEFFSKTLDLTGKLFCSSNRLQSIRKLPAVKMINVPFG